MSKTMRRMLLLVTLLLLVAGAAGASATDDRAATNKLTGCRNTSAGTLDQVKAGLLPMGGACGAGEVVVTWNKTGPRGPQGPTGATGATGAPGVSGYEVVSESTTYSSQDTRIVQLDCPAGKKAVGGGGFTSHFAVLEGSYPAPGGAGWVVLAIESPPTTQSWALTGFAICVTALP
jgi:hypothetical protein